MIAGGSAVVLLIVMFAFDWYGVEGVPGGINAWDAYDFVDIVLFITIVAAIGLAVASAMATDVNMPVAGSALVAGLGILSVVLIAFRILFTPDFGGSFAGFDVDVDTTRKVGVFLGLIAAIGIAYGGWVGMQEEGTSFGDQADRLQGGGTAPPPSGPAA